MGKIQTTNARGDDPLNLAELSGARLAALSPADDSLEFQNLIIKAIADAGHSIELIKPIGSGTFSDNFLVNLDGQPVCMKMIGGMCGLAIGLEADRLATDLDVLEASVDQEILGCPTYFGAVRETGSGTGAVLAYFKEYVEGKSIVDAIYDGDLETSEVSTAVKEIFDQRVSLGFWVWDAVADDFFVRAGSEGLPLVERLVLVDPSTPLLSRIPDGKQDPVDLLMEDFVDCLTYLVAHKGGSPAA